ncbi:hypothetical protein TcasGA2_TC000264 [Tribolium castaneum]|uniref:Uncharacterized protein n=1 Tax=Tribolium castaneum TaxID=7070 RepID=D6WBP7_TRICA|nr:hypothetical protein TcasGA2_TC000264 [Tribolium castaneum]
MPIPNPVDPASLDSLMSAVFHVWRTKPLLADLGTPVYIVSKLPFRNELSKRQVNFYVTLDASRVHKEVEVFIRMQMREKPLKHVSSPGGLWLFCGGSFDAMNASF